MTPPINQIFDSERLARSFNDDIGGGMASPLRTARAQSPWQMPSGWRSKVPLHAAIGRGGFSLVEVTVSIGIVAFAFMAVVGMVPAGMRAAEEGHEQGRATEVLNTAAAAVLGQRHIALTSRFAFGDWLNDSPTPQVSPRGYAPGEPEWESTNFAVMENGVIRTAGDTTSPARYKMFVRVTPPATSDQPVKVYVSVAWPAAAEWDSAKKEWKNNQGQVDALLYANPPDSL